MADEYDPLDGLFEAEPAASEEQEGDAPKQEQAPAAEAPLPEEPSAEEPPATEPKMVPLAALEEARSRARDAEARLAERDKPKEEPPAERPAIRDPAEDPQGAMEDLMGTFEFNSVNQALNVSRRFAAMEHGKELIDKVQAWALEKFDKDPQYAAKVIYSEDPYELALADYNAEQALAKASTLPPEILEGLTEDEVALLREHRAKNAPKEDVAAEEQPAEDTQPREEDGKFKSRREVAAPPRSILAAPSGNKSNLETAVGTGVAFDDAFK